MRVLGLIVSLILGVPEPSAVAAASETELHIHLGDEEEPRNRHAADYNDNENSTADSLSSLRCPTEGGDTCVFPFKWGSHNYTKCAYNDHAHTWCATTLKENGEYELWDYCDPAKCHGPWVRLNTYPAGRVELYKDGKWGTLCGHAWWNNEKGAENICKELGYTGGTKYTAPGGIGPILAGNRLCSGGEETIWDCPLQGERNDTTRCTHEHDQGVRCEGESVRCPTTGGDICVFPFKSKWGTHTNCAANGHIYTWCATTLTADGEYDDWDYCEPAKCHGADCPYWLWC